MENIMFSITKLTPYGVDSTVVKHSNFERLWLMAGG